MKSTTPKLNYWMKSVKLNDKFDQLQCDVCITKNVDNLLSSRLADIKR